MISTSALRVCGPQDRAEVLALLARDPVANVFVAARIEAVGLERWRLGGELWGYVAAGRLVALCYAGANLVPACADATAVAAFAERARRQGRHCASIVGPAEMVGPLWAALEPTWGPAREVRAAQPLCAIGAAPLVPPDPAVRPVRAGEIDVLLPASIAMFTEEVGVSPLLGDGGAAYRAGVLELVRAGRALARIEDGRVVFKAELGAVSGGVAQVQGVWVAPEARGRGLAEPGMAAVVQLARERFAPQVSLYVNDFNDAARATYARVGFEQVGTFSSVLF